MMYRPARRSRRNCWRNNISTSGSSSTTRISRLMSSPRFVSRRYRTRQNDSEFTELAGPRIDLYRPRVLLDDDVVTDRKTESGSLTSRLGRKERTEKFVPHFGGNAGAIVAYS